MVRAGNNEDDTVACDRVGYQREFWPDYGDGVGAGLGTVADEDAAFKTAGGLLVADEHESLTKYLERVDRIVGACEADGEHLRRTARGAVGSPQLVVVVDEIRLSSEGEIVAGKDDVVADVEARCCGGRAVCHPDLGVLGLLFSPEIDAFVSANGEGGRGRAGRTAGDVGEEDGALSSAVGD